MYPHCLFNFITNKAVLDALINGCEGVGNRFYCIENAVRIREVFKSLRTNKQKNKEHGSEQLFCF